MRTEPAPQPVRQNQSELAAQPEPQPGHDAEPRTGTQTT
jgi:hypothetical protein